MFDTEVSVQLPEVRCIEWMDALRAKLAEAESQKKAHFKDQQYHYWEGVVDGMETALETIQSARGASIENKISDAYRERAWLEGEGF